MIRLLLADDHTIITDGITDLLADEKGIDIVKVCKNGQEVLDSLLTFDPDIVLLDIDMPVMNGIQCAEEILKRDPRIKIAMLTMHAEKAWIKKFIEMGVKGYFLKTIDKLELVKALYRIHDGEEYFTADITRALMQEKPNVPDVNRDPLMDDLTEREIEVIKAVAKGLSNKQIAEHMHISPRTVDTHRGNIMKKLEVNNVAAIIRFAFMNGLVD